MIKVQGITLMDKRVGIRTVDAATSDCARYFSATQMAIAAQGITDAKMTILQAGSV
jgi:hypothetical protein